MSLNQKDKVEVRSFWKNASPRAAEIGVDAFGRMLTAYPQTKIYFSHWGDLSPTSASVTKHGATIMAAVDDGVSKIDDLVERFEKLSEVHAVTQRVDPVNFKIFSHCVLVVLAIKFPADFTPSVHVAMDKFLAALARALSDKFR